ncbi:hypothetical protein JYU34_000125 [Plutella xylostella]|uniref:CCHC-type domain-containing protein n=1 Tax=Plutella xylostella TaxID=51655 RepID=A0ABQ7R6X6_PLUXY|nr:hypothetical protein JYU34_000125 [Plutella xylostella]
MALTAAQTMNIEKFDGSNFRQWKFQMKCAMQANGIDISKPKPATKEGDWLKKDGMAMYILTSSMELKQITLIENCETAQEIMLKMESIYEQKSELNKMVLHERFYQYRMSSSESVAEHISKVENLAQQLKDSGENVSELAIITKILGTLPAKYRSLRQAWMSLDVKQQTLSNLTARLLDEEASLKHEEKHETALLVANNKQKNAKEASAGSSMKNRIKHRFECYNCGKRGHFSKECRAPRKGSRNPVGKNMLALNIETNLSEVDDTWILDSGASAHMSCRRDYFEELVQCDEKLTLANKHNVEVKGIGKIKIKRMVDGQWEQSMLEGVLYVPSLRRNVVSEGVILRKGYTVIKKHPNAMIYKENEVVMTGNITENNLFELKIEVVKTKKNDTQVCSQEEINMVESSPVKSTDSKRKCQEIENSRPFDLEVNLRSQRKGKLEANNAELSQEAIECPRNILYSEVVKEERIAVKENRTWCKVEDTTTNKDENGRATRRCYKARRRRGDSRPWCSQKQKTMPSTTEAECVAARKPAKETLWLRDVLLEIGENDIFDCTEWLK